MGDLWGNSERPTLLPKLTDTYQDFSQREIKVFTQDYDNNSDRNGHVKMPVLLQGVQDDIRVLREQIANNKGGTISIQDLESALVKTEEGLQAKTEQVINQYNNQVRTLPNQEASRFDNNVVAIETTWDMRNQKSADPRKISAHFLGRERMRQPQASRNNALLPKRQSVQMPGPTPGQQTKHMLTLRAVLDPQSNMNRQTLNENFGIQLPLINSKQTSKPAYSKPIIGSTIEPLAVLPKANRVDAQLAPPPITEEDARKGIMSLIERGLIPPAAQLTLDPSPVRNRIAPLHEPQVRHRPPQTEAVSLLSGVKLDPATMKHDASKMPAVPPHPKSASSSITETRTPSAKTRVTSSSLRQVKTPATLKTYEMPIQPLPPPTTPASGDFKQLSHRFAIQNGRTRDSSSEFIAFKQHYCLTWGSIVTMIKHIEKMLTSYAVPVAFVNGDRLADLAMEFELERPPTVDDLLTVIINREDVEALIGRPGRRFKGPRGKDLAATRIQSSWRMFKDRSEYLEYRRRKWASGVIAISWIMHVKMSKVKVKLKVSREEHLENFRRRARKLAMSWDRIKQHRRTVIHIPSLGLSQDIRDSINEFGIRQNTQMARLCDIRDPNVDVIFVSPVPLSEETLQYYSKLLGLKSAVESGVVEDQCDMGEKYKIIVPEAIKSFPAHRMCLSTLLKYSPRTLKRIKHLIKGCDAYIVTGVPHKDDLSVADYLDVPILSPEPEVAHLYSTKSGCKRVFASAGVEVPPSEFDVYSIGQLHECLAQLVTENLTVKRWLFKLDDCYDGRGIGYCDIAEHLECYQWALKESRRYGEKWNKKWAQEAAYIKIHAEIADVLAKYARPVHEELYEDWSKFLDAFLSQGGVIEATPPSDSITSLTVDMLIEPTGRANVLCMGDQIHAETPFSCWGVSMPQSSVEPDVLNAACKKVAEACKSRGIIGYLSVDFVTFIDSKTNDQKLWALDLSLHYSDSLAMFQLMSYVSNGKLDLSTHTFNVPPPPQVQKKRRRRLAGQDDEPPPNTSRYAVMSTRLLHTNLAVVHYSVFFQMCRAHGIGYDIKEKQGTVFTLLDSFNREHLGMLTIGDNLQGALATFARNMSVIHQEISAPNMQGETNFKLAITDIESILGTTVENAEDTEAE
ncbi:IQ domain-containing protein H-like isoform X2 [Crassostrea angulata]|uniref:IQ domain-containing protein H-like isoform X2 n=1 Tax=Magallana angulata TaxID=2784310 RepID=UPI0022B21B09|nr:IQ domain-containing protein H-like isoform X2 [Crassostrea angulata]